jgi:hypothetical protein
MQSLIIQGSLCLCKPAERPTSGFPSFSPQAPLWQPLAGPVPTSEHLRGCHQSWRPHHQPRHQQQFSSPQEECASKFPRFPRPVPSRRVRTRIPISTSSSSLSPPAPQVAAPQVAHHLVCHRHSAYLRWAIEERTLQRVWRHRLAPRGTLPTPLRRAGKGRGERSLAACQQPK